jgi:hypothetical protein
LDEVAAHGPSFLGLDARESAARIGFRYRTGDARCQTKSVDSLRARAKKNAAAFPLRRHMADANDQPRFSIGTNARSSGPM